MEPDNRHPDVVLSEQTRGFLENGDYERALQMIGQKWDTLSTSLFDVFMPFASYLGDAAMADGIVAGIRELKVVAVMKTNLVVSITS